MEEKKKKTPDQINKELREIWLNENAKIFCSGYCEKYYHKIKKRKKN